MRMVAEADVAQHANMAVQSNSRNWITVPLQWVSAIHSRSALQKGFQLLLQVTSHLPNPAEYEADPHRD